MDAESGKFLTQFHIGPWSVPVVIQSLKVVLLPSSIKAVFPLFQNTNDSSVFA